ncbi:TolC family protein [Rufibacter sediminis]|uniref:TolC family protein n=1 Tax=Rufibacter sediminis TaxID=2762756 RepID=A0ABR6VYN0_9BACT|nr:TolC family protein [Rufibacter sediminis]MBC3542264.1 TolC family protein [Rufibacter sediminis]
MLKPRLIFLHFLLVFTLQPVLAQFTATSSPFVPAPSDSLRVTLLEAEQLFQERNLPLLAQKTAIEASRAAVIQARLFENPVLSVDQGVYNPTNSRYFDLSKQGQTYVQVDQLFYLAGKRNKRVQVEQLNTQLTEQAYFDLLRTLRFALRTSFIELHYKMQGYQVLQERTQAVQRLVTALDQQYKKGNIPLKEITRLKALLFQLGNQQLSLLNEIQEEQAELRLLTGTPATTTLVPLVEETALQPITGNQLNFTQLLETAQENRFDLKSAETDVQLQQANLKLQKALAVPDLTVGANYDRQSNFIRDYVGLNLSVPLPLWNRNQGNIKMAQHEVERSQQLLTQQQRVVENEVMQAYLKAQEAQKFYASFDPNFRQDFDRLLEGVTSSFVRRNISLIEFLDYYETYTDSITQLLELSTNRLRTLEEINFTVGKPVISY